MNKAAISSSMLQLLVRAHNRSIQEFYFFPDVILCEHGRFDRAEFDAMENEGFFDCIHADSFGKTYRLSLRGEAALKSALHRRSRYNRSKQQPTQTRLVLFEQIENK